MTKTEIKNLSNYDLVKHFDSITVSLTHEANSRRGTTKKTSLDYELTKTELLNRLGVPYTAGSEEWY